MTGGEKTKIGHMYYTTYEGDRTSIGDCLFNISNDHSIIETAESIRAVQESPGFKTWLDIHTIEYILELEQKILVKLALDEFLKKL